jgi:3-isopropylmalate/(R)-2-methylmalate dehydratase small subunit
MKAFTTVTAKAAPLDRPNVDTDAIIPKQYLKSIKRTGFGQYLFDDWRYLDQGDLDIPVATRRPNPEFVLNQAAYRDAKILVSRENFGCGSSREHAVWALEDYGFRAVIAPSYADIFFNNSFKNGFLPIILKPDEVQQVFDAIAKDAATEIIVDLPAQQVKLPGGEVFTFEIDEFRKDCLVRGLDEIGLTLQSAAGIRAYEEKRKASAPWLFN